MRQKIYKISVLKNPKVEANRTYYSVFKKNINWDNPKNLIEKIYWLQFNTDTSLWTKCADKYLVRDYVKECGYENNLAKLYGKWDIIDDIDFLKLPRQFVLKANNGCGTVMIVRNKEDLNIKETKKKLKRWLNLPYGYNGAQLHYTKIKPYIIAEELLENKKEDMLNNSNVLIDYKIWCINGEPDAIIVVYDRTETNYSLSAFDLDWNNISEFVLETSQGTYGGIGIEKPKSLGKLIEMAEKLSEGIPQVRVDLYEVNGKPVFGEMTFTTGYGDESLEYFEYLGSKIDLSKIKKK